MERFIEMLDSINEHDINMQTVVVGKPQPIEDKYNTTVRVQGTLLAGTYIDRQIKYNRISLNIFKKRTVYWEGETDTVSLLNKINSEALFSYTLGHDEENAFSRQGFLKVADIVNETFSMTAGQSKDITIKANPQSYLYTGELSIALVG